MFWEKSVQGTWIPDIPKIIEKYLQLESQSNQEELAHFKDYVRTMTTKNGQSLLHIAAMEGQLENCEILIRMMEGINPTDYSGKTPIDYARRGGHVRIFWLLRNEITTTKIDNVQLEFLMDENVVDQTDNWRHIHCASALGHIEACKFYINNHVDLSVKTSEGMTPLFLAARGGHEEGLQDISIFGLSIKVPSISHHLDHQKEARKIGAHGQSHFQHPNYDTKSHAESMKKTLPAN